MNGWRVFLGRMIPAVAFLVLFVGAVPAHAGSISGTVSNTSGRNGRVFMSLQQEYGGDTGIGVSIAPTDAGWPNFTIRGVPNGSYNLKAFVDGIGTGMFTANDSTWTSPGIITINNGNYTVGPNSTVTFTSHPSVAPVAPAKAPQIIPGDNGAFVGWDEPSTKDANGNDVNIADSYKVYYSTVSATPRTSPQGVITVPASDNDFALFHYAKNTTLNVQVTALVGATESAASPVATKLITPPGTGVSVSGTINLSGISSPTGNLYIAVVDMAGKGGPVAVAYVANPPQLSNSFTINGVPNGTYSLFALIDMNSDGRIGSGDFMTTDNKQVSTLTVNGANLTGQTVTLTKSNSSPSLYTTHYQDANTPPSNSYQVVIGAKSQTETLVNLTVTNGPVTNGFTYPIDLGIGTNSWGKFQTWLNLNTNRPQLSDSYTLQIQYANIGPDSVNLPVTAVLDSFATPTAPQGYLTYPMPNPVVYAWTAPTSPPNPYTYSFWVNASGFYNNNDQYSNLPSYTTSQSIPGLSYDDGQQYNWNITVQDAAGNQAQKNVWFNSTSQPAISSFLPASAVPGNLVTITGFNFSTTPSNNTVYFGCGTSAPATTASATQLQVVVPPNACTGSLQVMVNNKSSSYSTAQLNILNTITFSGKVTASGLPASLSGVTVNLFSTLLNSTTISTADPTTNYSVSGIPAGQDFSIKFAKAAYDTAWTGINNSVSDITGRNIGLYPAGTLTGWNGGDTTKGAIRGRVQQQSDGTPIAGAVVTAPGHTVLYDSSDGKTPVSGSATGVNGVFFILQMPDNDSVVINAVAAGFIFNPLTAVGHAGTITSVGIRGFPAISVSGTVTNSAHTPLVGATIAQMGAPPVATSNAGGAFTINNIPGDTNFELKMSQGTAYVPTYTGWLSSSTSFTLPFPFVFFTPTELTGLGITAGKGAIIGLAVNAVNPLAMAAISGLQVTAPNHNGPNYTVLYYDQTLNSGLGGYSLTATATDASGMFLIRDVDDSTAVDINAGNAPDYTIYGEVNITTHAPGVSEIAVPCNVPSVAWGNLEYPATTTIMTTQATGNIFGQVYLHGVTDSAPGPVPALVAELGYGPVGSDPTLPASGWVWKTAAYNNQVGNNYEFGTTLSVTTAGFYDYVYRYSYYRGQYTYGDLYGIVYGKPLNPGRLTVNTPAPTTTSVGVNLPDQSPYGSSLILSATVTSGTLGTITGTVQFKIDGGNFGSPVTLDGAASAHSSATTTQQAGAHTFTAVYNGDAAYNVSTSPGASLTIAKAAATVMLGTLNFTYDKSAKATSATTNPPGLTVAITYNGLTSAPTNVGSYPVVATVNNVNYQGTTSGTLNIGIADQTITFNALPIKYISSPAFDLTATTTSGLPISYISSAPTVASISGITVTILMAGTTTITASQTGDANYNAALSVDQTLTVNSAPKGDVTGDGVVDNLDARQTLQYVVGLFANDPATEAKCLANGDVAPLDAASHPLGDTKIDIRDALVMLQRSVNLLNW